MFILRNLYRILLLLVLCGQTLTIVTDDLIKELYSKYISAVSNDNFTISTRRLLKRNKEYEIHVRKLKEVNGHKKHNLLVKESLRSGLRDPYIYINNPVESKIPKAYLTLEEFKKALIDRVLKQKNEFTVKKTKKVTKNVMLVAKTGKKRTQSTLLVEKSERNDNLHKNGNLRTSVTTTMDTKTSSKSENTNKVKSTISATTVTEDSDKASNKIHEKNFTNFTNDTENTITLRLADATSKVFKSENKIGDKNQEINIDISESITENTKTTEISLSSSSSSSSNSELDKTLLTDTSTIFEDTISTEIVTTTENMATTEEYKDKEIPRRKKTVKSFSISTKKRRSTLGRPLVFIGSR